MRRLMIAGLLLAAGAAAAQQTALPLRLEAAPAPGARAPDAAETRMITEPPGAGSFGDWYAAQRRPALVVYFERRLAELPPGWEGHQRLLIDDTRQEGDKRTQRRLTVGLEHNTVQAREVSQFVQAFQLALEQELKRERLKVLDGAVLQRRESSSGLAGDLEYASLKRSARFVFEVALLDVGGEWQLAGVLKDLHSGELTASVRVPVQRLDSPDALARSSRQLVQQLLRQRIA